MAGSAYKIADRIALLHEGRIYTVGTPAEIQDSTDPVVRRFVNGLSDQSQEVQLAVATIH